LKMSENTIPNKMKKLPVKKLVEIMQRFFYASKIHSETYKTQQGDSKMEKPYSEATLNFAKKFNCTPEQVIEFAKEFSRSLCLASEMKLKSNKELATLLMNEIWADLDIFSKGSSIISETIQRLEKETKNG